MAMAREINVAVLGVGWWGSKVLRNFCESSSFTKVFAFDKDSERMRQALAQWKLQPLNDLDELWSRSDIGAVAVVTPPQTHFELIRQAFEHGKHVMVAKPPAQTTEQVEQLCALAEKNGLVFMVDSTFVFNPATLKIRQLVQEGLFPSLKFVQSLRYGNDLRFHSLQRVLNFIHVNRMDVVEDLAFHDVSVLRVVFGRPFAVRLVRRIHVLNPDLCDTAFIELDMGGVPVHIGHSWSMPVRTRQLILYDDEKFLLYDDLRRERKVEVYRFTTRESFFPEYPEMEPLHQVVEHFYSCIAEGREPLTGKDFIVDVMRASEEIQKFGLEGGSSA